jgi:hypothetical protein
MIAVAAASTTLGPGINAVRHTHFRRLAASYVVLDLRDPRDLSQRDRLIGIYHDVMADVFDRIADLLGEPLREDPFPDKTFEELRASIEDAPGCGFPYRSPASTNESARYLWLPLEPYPPEPE